MAQTNNPLTPVPLPAGAVFADDWQPEDPQPYRVIMGADRGIDGRDLRVRTSAIQFADGRIDGGQGVIADVVNMNTWTLNATAVDPAVGKLDR